MKKVATWLIWSLVVVLALYVVWLMVATPTPDKEQPGIMARWLAW